MTPLADYLCPVSRKPIAAFARILTIAAIGAMSAGSCICSAGLAQTTALMARAGGASATQPATSKELRFDARTGSRVVLRGNATIGSWSSVSKNVHARVLLPIKAANISQWLLQARKVAKHSSHAPALGIKHNPTAYLSLPVRSLDGGNSGMNHDMWAALKSKQHPNIRYQFRRVTAAGITRDPKSGQLVINLKVRGRLTLAGCTRRLVSHLIIEPLGAGRFGVHATSQVMMRDYGVTPPTAFFGLIRGHNRVRIMFDLTFKRESAAITTARR